MDKYEYKLRADEIKELIGRGEYASAAEIADTVDWRRVKSVMMLCTISDLYKMNRRFEDARDLLLLAYERRPGGRTICYSLCELSIKMEEFVQAIEYYKEFVQVAPKDPGRYILQYKLYEVQDVSLEERIQVLEELKKRDYREKWAYELAYLYHRIGLATQCVEECDELIIWFGEGKYVTKAMELKMLHQPLTPEQQYKYDHRLDMRREESYPAEEAYQTEQNSEYYGDGTPDENVPYDVVYPEDTIVETGYQETETYGESEAGNTIPSAETQIYEAASEEIPEQEDEPDFHVKTMDVGQYNTINLQAELAEGLKEVLASEPGMQTEKDKITRAIIEPMLESDTETLDYPQIDEIDEENLESAPESIEKSEVFFGETGEIGGLMTSETVPDITGEIVLEQMRQETVTSEEDGNLKEPEAMESADGIAEYILKAEPPKELARVLSQESDGQISLVVPDSTNVEKQITGQMNIEDILAEWERMKKENEEKRKEEVRQHVLRQTGSLFNEFEASVRDGLLEKLENGEVAQEELDKAASEALNDAGALAGSDLDIAEEDEIPAEEAAMNSEELEEVEVEEEEFKEPAEAEAEEEEFKEPAEAEAEEEEFEEPAEVEAEPEELTEQEAWEQSEDIRDTSEETKEEETDKEENETEEEIEESEEELEDEEATECEQIKPRALTREEKELYAPYIQSRSDREQLVKAIDSISMASYTGNLIVAGEEGMDTLTLAKNMIREIQMTDSNFSGKVAKITGEALNTKDPEKITKQLENGALIIANASAMNDETVKKLYKALQPESLGIVIVLEDTRKAINKLMEKHPELGESFNARIDMEPLSNDKLVAFGKQYAREQEFSIDELGTLALHTRIQDRQTSDHAVTVLEVKELVDKAIRHSMRKSIGHFMDVLFARRYDEEDMIILTEKDFEQ